ncbi:uncharacterized protein si:dkey-262k9.2 isoform X1 [Solea solea]|uniref:uncharacterized protein si:dkey-262k9.2 isoform X1 n=2 Tax=Solea solea TaxID=90069 RepID=UPI00272BF68D|nr:uncharacterized protein si:dkey-262k9.2 isoform X1 [Solea solea]
MMIINMLSLNDNIHAEVSLLAQCVYLCNRDKTGWCHISTCPAANGEQSSNFLTEYTCTNVHTHSGSFHDNKDLCVGAATYQQCVKTILNSSSLKFTHKSSVLETTTTFSLSGGRCSLACVTPTEHLKMMRLLFLCVLLLLPAATAVSDESEGSGDDDTDDEDLSKINDVHNKHSRGSSTVDKTTGEENTDQLVLVITVVAVAVVALSVAAIVAVMLVRRRMHSRQQGVYSVPTEQDHKGGV